MTMPMCMYDATVGTYVLVRMHMYGVMNHLRRTHASRTQELYGARTRRQPHFSLPLKLADPPILFVFATPCDFRSQLRDRRSHVQPSIPPAHRARQ